MHDTVERLHLSTGLGTPQCSSGRPGGSGYKEGLSGHGGMGG